MRRLPVIPALLVLVLLLIAWAAQSNRSAPAAAALSATSMRPTAPPAVRDGAAACPATKPPDPPFVPPNPWPAQAPNGEFWYGTAKLWTSLRPAGGWSGLPHNPAGYTQKIFLWPYGGEQPKLTVSGKPAGAHVPAYSTTNGTSACHADFGGCIMLTGVDLPSLGCWELTIEHAGDSLSFVVWVAP